MQWRFIANSPESSNPGWQGHVPWVILIGASLGSVFGHLQHGLSAGRSQSSHARIGNHDSESHWRQRMLPRSCLVLVVFLGLPALLCAQKQHGQWSDLNGLKVGQRIDVIE
jgi:hypothetical protein